ncbi:MAG: MipA/OmpV family protein [Pseudomonadota bacterium]
MKFSTNQVLMAAVAGSFLVTGSAASAEGSRSIVVGPQVVAKPKYEGSDEHDVYVIPLFIPKFSDSADENPSLFKKFRRRLDFRGLDDVRIRISRPGGFEFGVATGYISDRDQSDARRLRGLGDVDGGLLLGGYAGIRRGPVLFDAAVVDKVTGDDAGFQFRFGAETERQISPRTKVKARIGTTFADDDYMQTYFGVTPGQSARSSAGLRAFNASGGIKDIHVQLGTEIELTERWLVKATGQYARLLGDAADSPVIETEDQFSGTLGFGYRFYLSR